MPSCSARSSISVPFPNHTPNSPTHPPCTAALPDPASSPANPCAKPLHHRKTDNFQNCLCGSGCRCGCRSSGRTRLCVVCPVRRCRTGSACCPGRLCGRCSFPVRAASRRPALTIQWPGQSSSASPWCYLPRCCRYFQFSHGGDR